VSILDDFHTLIYVEGLFYIYVEGLFTLPQALVYSRCIWKPISIGLDLIGPLWALWKI